MEASALFVWCATEGGGLPCGAVNAIFANRHTNEWKVAGEELAAEVALEALLLLKDDATLTRYVARELPAYPESGLG
jgi:uridine phosphorylase